MDINQALTSKGIKPEGATNDKFPYWLLITLIVFGTVMITWQLVLCKSACSIGDMWTYMSAWENLRRLHPDPMRPPVYPILLGCTHDLFGAYAGGCVMMVLQWSIWIAGCRWSWLILRHFNVGRQTSSVVILLLMAFPGTWVLNNLLQTDGLATGGMPLLIWQLIKYRESRQKKWITRSGLLLLAYLFLKPQFIFLIPLWGIAWIYTTFREKENRLWAAGIVVVAATSLVVYQWSLYHCYRQTFLSKVTPMNNYYGLRMAGLIHVDEIADSTSRELLRPFIEADPGTDLPDYYLYWPEIWFASPKQLDDIWKHTYALHRAEVHAFIWHRIPQSLNYNIFYRVGHNRRAITDTDIAYYEALHEKAVPDEPCIVSGRNLFKATPQTIGTLLYPLYGIMEIPFWFAWLAMALFSIWYCIKWYKRKTFPVVPFFMASILWGGYIVAFVGAPGDWGRLVTPYCMILFIICGIIISNVKKTLSGRRLGRRGFASLGKVA